MLTSTDRFPADGGPGRPRRRGSSPPGGVFALPPAVRFRQDPSAPGASGKPEQTAAPEAEEDTRPDILCRQCRQSITEPDQRIAVQGNHRHTFANPHGIVFDIGCFSSVRNCGVLGAATAEFSWFGGFRWQIVICSSCLTHLGWRFTSAGPAHFFGLILDRLVAPE